MSDLLQPKLDHLLFALRIGLKCLMCCNQPGPVTTQAKPLIFYSEKGAEMSGLLQPKLPHLLLTLRMGLKCLMSCNQLGPVATS